MPARAGRRIGGAPLGIGVATAYLSIIVLIPLGAVAIKSSERGWDGFWSAISSPQATSTLKLTVVCSLIVVAINIVMGTLIAWVLVRDDFRGKGVVNSLIDLPFALPTIVAGLTLLALYGPKSPFGFSSHAHTCRYHSPSPSARTSDCPMMLGAAASRGCAV